MSNIYIPNPIAGLLFFIIIIAIGLLSNDFEIALIVGLSMVYAMLVEMRRENKT